MSNPYQVVKDFEQALCDYTGAKYAVTTTSCTMAIFLALKYDHINWYEGPTVNIPKHTYVSVPQQIIHAGYKPTFRDEDWQGEYNLGNTYVWDSARRFTSGMYDAVKFQCVSFHWSKILGLSQGGAILHDDDEADVWFRKARFDGRTEGVAPKDDTFDMLGYHCYMSPEVAAHGLMKMSLIPEHNEDLPRSDYPDLSKINWSQM